MDNFLEKYSNWLDESKEHLSNEAIATYLNLKNILSEKEKEFIENHLKLCTECEKKFNLVVAEDKEMDEASLEEEHNQDIEKKEAIKIFTLERIVKYSVAAIIAVGLVLATYYSFFQEEKVIITERKKTEHKLDTLRKSVSMDSISIPLVKEAEKEGQEKVKLKTDLKSFAVNDILESFVHRNIRSETEIEIMQPDIDDTIKFPFTFKWTQKSFMGTNKLLIVDNQNKTLYQADISGKEITIDQKLTDGLYYWKLETNGKLGVVGKFFVVK